MQVALDEFDFLDLLLLEQASMILDRQVAVVAECDCPLRSL